MYIAGEEAVFRRYKAVIMEMHAEAREAYLDSESRQ